MSNERKTGKQITRWADEAMFEAEPMPFNVNEIGPRVHLLHMSSDPLGQIAAFAMMYEGKVARSLSGITDEQRRHYFAQVAKTHLKAPFEAVHFHFMVEGVTRSFTHQMVRQRTAVFAQESLRFAVKDGIDEEVALPPALRSLKDDDPRVVLWRKAVNGVEDVYHALVDAGVPAEDARGLLPHNITTRLNYATNLRNLQDHAGMRLCTQAQFEWRAVWVRIVEAIRNYGNGTGQEWQYELLANLFRPVCYLTGKCEFKADFDRKCKIRDRVDLNHDIGRDSSLWHTDNLDSMGSLTVEAINPAEWLTDPSAAR